MNKLVDKYISNSKEAIDLLKQKIKSIESDNLRYKNALEKILTLPETIGHAYEMKDIARKALKQ